MIEPENEKKKFRTELIPEYEWLIVNHEWAHCDCRMHTEHGPASLYFISVKDIEQNT